jgi:beta-lactamase class A
MYPIRKLFTILIVSLVLLVIGRNLTFLPKIPFVFNKATVYNTALLKNSITTLFAKQKGHYSMLFVDLNHPENTVGITEHMLFTGASVNKVPIIATLYFLANKGAINLDQKIVLQKKDIQDYGTGSLRYQKPGGVYSLKTLAKLTLQQSDNTAAHILGEKLRTQTIQDSMKDFGLTQTNMANNKTSLSDMALLYQKIYKKEVTSPALTKELLDFMKDTDIENRLPGQLPKTALVYHKTGDGIGFVHDVGIIKEGNHVYFFGVMSADVGGYEDEATSTIAQVSKYVYDYMKSQE